MNGTSTSKCLVYAFKSIDLAPTIILHLSKTTLKWPKNGKVRVPRHSEANCLQKMGGHSERGRFPLKGWKGSSQQGKGIRFHNTTSPKEISKLTLAETRATVCMKPEMGSAGRLGIWDHWPWAGWVLVIIASAWCGLTSYMERKTEISHGDEQWHL